MERTTLMERFARTETIAFLVVAGLVAAGRVNSIEDAVALLGAAGALIGGRSLVKFGAHDAET